MNFKAPASDVESGATPPKFTTTMHPWTPASYDDASAAAADSDRQVKVAN
jgi:hypothetical protein